MIPILDAPTTAAMLKACTENGGSPRPIGSLVIALETAAILANEAGQPDLSEMIGAASGLIQAANRQNAFGWTVGEIEISEQDAERITENAERFAREAINSIPRKAAA